MKSLKQVWEEKAKACDIARDAMWSARDSGKLTDNLFAKYEQARKAEHDAFFAYTME